MRHQHNKFQKYYFYFSGDAKLVQPMKSYFELIKDKEECIEKEILRNLRNNWPIDTLIEHALDGVF